MKGLIKKLSDERKFGFISSQGAKDIFFHANSLVGVTFDELREGDSVSFDIANSEKGMNAINVKRV